MDSNPTLSAKLFKINKLPRLLTLLERICFVFGMRDMQVYKARCVPLRLKPIDWAIIFPIGERGIFQPQVGASGSGAPN